MKILSSVNREPRRAIEEGFLRADLFYRLGVVYISIPPLRDRHGDIEKLAHHFLDKHNRALAKVVTGISGSVMDIFNSYHWPGNVRELEHVIEGAMNIIGSNESIESSHLRTGFAVHARRPRGTKTSISTSSGTSTRSPANHSVRIRRSAITTAETPGKSLVEAQADREKMAIEEVLSRHRGNASRAAASIGISRQLLHYKMKKYNLDRKDFI